MRMCSALKPVRQAAIVMIIALAVFALDWMLNGKEAEQKQKLIQVDAAAVNSFAGAELVESHSDYKTSNGVVTQTYLVSSTSAAVVRWYQEELLRRGWQMRDEKGTNGEKTVRFCQQHRSASLIIENVRPQEASPYLIRYRIKIGWGGPFYCE